MTKKEKKSLRQEKKFVRYLIIQVLRVYIMAVKTGVLDPDKKNGMELDNIIDVFEKRVKKENDPTDSQGH